MIVLGNSGRLDFGWIRELLVCARVPGNFTSHSFRIGGVTVAARHGIPYHRIKALGHWLSNAYHSYVRTTSETLAYLLIYLTKK